MRYIIFRPGYFGDTLVAFPLVAALQAHGDVCFITNIGKRNLVMGDDVISLLKTKPTVFQYCRADGMCASFKKLKQAIYPRPDDVLVYAPISGIAKWRVVRDYLFFKMLGFRKIIGLRNYLRPRHLPGEREFERLLNNVSLLGLSYKQPPDLRGSIVDVPPPEEVRCSLESGNRIVVVCPGSKMQSKRWPIDRYVRCLDNLSEISNISIFLVGSKDEESLGTQIKESSKAKCVSFFGRSFLELTGLMRCASMYFGNDTGPMHLAALLGVPCVAIFSSRAVEGLWYPYGENHQIYRKKISCQGCGLQTCFVDPPKCLSQIETLEVIDSLREVLGGKELH